MKIQKSVFRGLTQIGYTLLQLFCCRSSAYLSKDSELLQVEWDLWTIPFQRKNL